MKNCFIVGSGECKNLYIPQNCEKYVIAADGGFDTLVSNSVVPDMVLGDFDSAKQIPKFGNLCVYPREKDETDTSIALKKAMELECENIFIYGGTGGREDHTFANIQLLGFAADYNISAYLIYENMVATVIKNRGISFDSDEAGYVSILAYGDNATGVSVKGLKYEVTDTVLKNTNPLGVSNEFAGKKSEVSVKNGKLLIMWQTNPVKAVDKLIKTNR